MRNSAARRGFKGCLILSAPLSVVVLRIPDCMEQQSYTERVIKLQKVLVMNNHKSRRFARVTSSSLVASPILDGASASASYIANRFPKQQSPCICGFLSATVLHLRSSLVRNFHLSLSLHFLYAQNIFNDAHLQLQSRTLCYSNQRSSLTYGSLLLSQEPAT